MNFFKLYLSIIKKIRGHGLYKVPLVLKLNSFILKNFKTKEVEFFSYKLLLDKYDKYHLSSLDYKIPDAVKDSILPGQTVIDVGASIGIYTIFFAKMVGEKGRVYAFEPESRIFELLKKNVEINGFKNVILENKAVSNISGIVKMETVGDYNRITKNYSKPTFDVTSVSIDDYFEKKSDKINFIKIDAEGHDGYVILGANETLTKNQHIKILVEFHTKFMRDAGIEPSNFLKILQDVKLKITDLNNGKSVDESYIKKFNIENSYSTNFFCEK